MSSTKLSRWEIPPWSSSPGSPLARRAAGRYRADRPGARRAAGAAVGRHRRIEDCQEVQILGEDPYTAQQLLNNAVRLLLQTGLYTRDFEDWDRKIAADKIWTNLKMFIQEAYTRRLNATSITTGAQGYVQNAYAALAEESEEEDDDVHTVITQMAALTTQSQLTANTAAETNASVTAAINQLAANQQAMQQQFAAFTASRNTTYQPTLLAPPPMQQLTIPSFG